MEALENKGLSSLPDDILVEILSYLPINYAASTSVLSCRWQFLWTQIHNVDLNRHLFPRPDIMYKTFNHISQQLTCSKFDAFYLDAPYPTATLTDSVSECFSAINSSIHQFCQRQVHDIFVAFGTFTFDKSIHQLFRVPLCVLNNSHLLVLKLHGKLQIDNFFNLPNSEELSLSVESLRCKLLNNLLLESSPNLKRLTLDVQIMDMRTSSFCLSSRKLEYLDVSVSFEDDTEFVNDDEFIDDVEFVKDDGEFVIDTPNLKRLEINTGYQKKYRFVRKPSKLVKAQIWGEFNLNHDDVTNTQAIELFRVIYNVKNLRIDAGIVKALKLLYNDDGFPLFESIKTPGTRFTGCEGNWDDVLFSVQCFPSVEYLKLSRHFLGWPDFKWLIDFKLGSNGSN